MTSHTDALVSRSYMATFPHDKSIADNPKSLICMYQSQTAGLINGRRSGAAAKLDGKTTLFFLK